MKSLGENLTDAEIEEMVREADKDGNGSIDCEFFFFNPSFFVLVPIPSRLLKSIEPL